MSRFPRKLIPRVTYLARVGADRKARLFDRLSDAVRAGQAGDVIVWGRYERGDEMTGVVSINNTILKPRRRKK